MYIMQNSITHKLGRLLLPFLVIAPYVLCCFGLDFTDSPYHLVKAADYLKQPQAVLSYHLIHLWQTYVTQSLLITRLFSVLLWQLTALFLLWCVRKSLNQSSLLFASLAFSILLLCRPLYSLSYDTLSTLMITWTFCCLYMYQAEGYSRGWLLAGAVLSSLSIFLRLPNIPIVLGGCFWLLGLCSVRNVDRKRAWLDLAIYVAVFSFVTLVVFKSYYLDLHQAAQAYVPNSTSRGIQILLIRYVQGLIKCLGWIGVFCLCALGYNEWKSSKNSFLWSVLFMAGMSMMIAYSVFLEMQMYYPDLNHLLVSLFLCLLGAVAYRYVTSGALLTKNMLLVLGVLFFAVLPIAGSDTGIIKVEVSFFILVAVTVYWDQINTELKWATATLLLAALCCAGVQRLKMQYEDRSIIRLRGIYTSPGRKAFVESVLKEASASKGSFILVGKVRFLFDYLLGQSGDYSSLFWSNLNNKAYVADVERYMDKKQVDTVFVVPEYPECLVPSADNILETMLLKRRYACTKSAETYRVYTRIGPFPHDVNLRPVSDAAQHSFALHL
jgi:hypothetical protein